MRPLLWMMLLSSASGCNLVTGITDFETNDFVGQWTGSGKVVVGTETRDVSAKVAVDEDGGMFEILAASPSFDVDVDYVLNWEQTAEREFSVDLLCTPPNSCVVLHNPICQALFSRPCAPGDPQIPPVHLVGRCVTSEDAERLECGVEDGDQGVQFLCAYTREG